jgi:hypothetical protein
MKIKLKTWYRTMCGEKAYILCKDVSGKLYVGETKDGLLFYLPNGKVWQTDPEITHSDEILCELTGSPSFTSRRLYTYERPSGEVVQTFRPDPKSTLLSQEEVDV